VETPDNEEKLRRSAALQHARAILRARDRTEDELIAARDSLQERTKELSQQREWFQVTLSSIGDAVITTDLNGKVTFLNPMAEKMTGWKSPEATGRPLEQVFNIIDEKTRLPLDNPLHKALIEGVVVGLANHTILIGREGVEIAIEDSAAPIRDAAGKISGAVMVFHDVTERRKMEAVLRTNHDQFSAMIDQSPIRILLVDSDFRVRHINASAKPTFAEIDNLIGREFAEVMNILWPSEVAEEIVERFRHTLTTGESFIRRGFSERRADRDTVEYYDWEIHRITLPSGEHGVAFYFTDTSAHVLAQRALVERARLAALRADISMALATAANLRSVLQQCAQAMVTHLDAAFARIWTVNETEDFLELQASAGIYTHLNGAHGRIKIGEFKIGRIAKNRQPLTTNDVLHDPNISSPEWARKEGMVAFAGYPLVLEGKIVGVMAMFARHPWTRDVLAELAPIADGLAQWARRRLAEEALVRAQTELQRHAVILEQTVEERTAQLREKIGELEAFSYSVSHDMRSPLRAMQGYSVALLNEHKQNLNPEGQHYLERIHKAATRMDLLIQEVLTYSRIAKEHLTLTPVDLEKLISEIRQAYPILQGPTVTLTIQGPLPEVLGQEALLTQILSNLLGNAVKFLKPGNNPSVVIRAEAAGTGVKVWVEDNGIGIDPAHFKRIFDIFGRVYGDKKFEGTGIGLAIAKKAAERMGGDIGVESQLGQGSRFWFTLKKA
jgi:PAS domain S-box-containing protein